MYQASSAFTDSPYSMIVLTQSDGSLMSQDDELRLIDSFLLNSDNLKKDYKTHFYVDPKRRLKIPDVHFFGIDTVLCMSELALDVLRDFTSECVLHEILVEEGKFYFVLPNFKQVIDIQKSKIKWYGDPEDGIPMSISHPTFLPDTEKFGIIRDKNYSYIRYIFSDKFVDRFRSSEFTDLRFSRIE